MYISRRKDGRTTALVCIIRSSLRSARAPLQLRASDGDNVARMAGDSQLIYPPAYGVLLARQSMGLGPVYIPMKGNYIPRAVRYGQ